MDCHGATHESLVFEQTIVKTECLALTGATWTHVRTIRPSGTVLNIWKHVLPHPAELGASPHFDSKGRCLFSPVWSSRATGNEPFVCAAIKAVAKVKVTYFLYSDFIFHI